MARLSDRAQARATAPMGEHASVLGQIAPGNINLNTRPKVPNGRGGYSTVRSISFSDNQGREILIPTVVGRRIVSNRAAIDHYYKTGQHLGIFSSIEAANRYSIQLHKQQEKEYG